MTGLFLLLWWACDLYVVWQHCSSDMKVVWGTEDLDEIKREILSRWKARDGFYPKVKFSQLQTRTEIGEQVLTSSLLIPALVFAPIYAPVLLVMKAYSSVSMAEFLYGYKVNTTSLAIDATELEMFKEWQESQKELLKGTDYVDSERTAG